MPRRVAGPNSRLAWFKTPYCIAKNINEKTVAKPVREYLRYISSAKMPLRKKRRKAGKP